ncbi:hypothetical protein WKW77_19980 [Variovorax ureilyticus]|uniref:Uncharacterized protein n=1 Tax=Variovorax ureilyticus TaxID=1836198 RepID=A0ABU8VJN2_9BURK
MTSQEKAAVSGNAQAAQGNKQNGYFLIARRILKATIVVLALRGWLPYGTADWLIQRGGLSHV